MLIRALEPTDGLEQMRSRRAGRPDAELCAGPGKLTEALGIGLDANGADLCSNPFRLLAPEPGWSGAGGDRSAGRHYQGSRAPLALLRLRQSLRIAPAPYLTS